MNRTTDKRSRTPAKKFPPAAGTNGEAAQEGQPATSGQSCAGVSNSDQSRSLQNRASTPGPSRVAPGKSPVSNAAVNRNLSAEPTVQFAPDVITAKVPAKNGKAPAPPPKASGGVIELDPVTITAGESDDEQKPEGKSKRPADVAPAKSGQPQPVDAKQPGSATGTTATERTPGGALQLAPRAALPYVNELIEPKAAEPPASISALGMMSPLPLLWQVLTGVFAGPPARQFDGLKPPPTADARKDQLDAKRIASERYHATAALAGQHHEAALAGCNSSIQSVYNDYFVVSNQLLSDFQQSDDGIESAYQWSVSQVFSGAVTADQLILISYSQARGALSGAVASSKAAIQASATSAPGQITNIVTGMGKDFVEPIDKAKGECEQESKTAHDNLRKWIAEIESHFPNDGELQTRVGNEAKRLAGPKLAEKTLKSLTKATADVVAQFDGNKKMVVSDLDVRVAQPLTKYAGEIVGRGNADVDKAFGRAFGALKRQADTARRANAESRAATIEQLLSLRRAERERLEQQMEMALTAVHRQAEAAIVALFSSNCAGTSQLQQRRSTAEW